MRILVDMQGAQTSASRNRGVGVYTNELVKELICTVKKTDEIYLILNGAFRESCLEIIKIFSAFLPASHIKVWQPYINQKSENTNPFAYNDVSALIKEWYMSQFLPDIVWSTNLQEGLVDRNVGVGVFRLCENALYCSTLHDVTPIMFQDEYLQNYDVKEWYWQKINDVINSDIILTVSNFSKEKICELLNVNKDDVHVAENGVNHNLFRPISIDIKDKENYILYVGGADNHKNLKRLLAAYNELPNEIKSKYYLYLAGNGIKEKIGSEAKKYRYQPIYIENAPNEKIAELMEKCSLFVFPSYAEGFGLPVVEAMAGGAPTITSDQTSLKELACDSEAIFDPFDVQSISTVMEKILSNPVLANTLIQKGINKSAKYSWKKSANKIVEIFEYYFSKKKSKSIACTLENLISNLKQLKEYDSIDKVLLAQTIANNIVSKKEKRLYIDLSVIAKNDLATGIQRVVRSIANILLGNQEKYGYEIIPVCSDENFNYYYEANFDGKSFTAPKGDERLNKLIDFSDGDILLLLDLDFSNAITKKDYYNTLMMRGVKVLFIVYDLIPYMFEEGYFPEGIKYAFGEWLKTITKSDGVICISNDVSVKVNQYIKDNSIEPKPRFYNSYFHLGADITKSVPSKGLPENYKTVLDVLNKKITILMVSTIEPRKMHEQVFDAVELLWNKGYDINLVFVGKLGWNVDKFAKRIKSHKEVNNHFFFLEGISDEYLEMIYDASSVVLMASLAEGFGLSIIEGAMHHKPLILRDLPVFKEIANDAAFYFEGTSADSLADALVEWIELYKKGLHPKSEQIEILTWEDSATMLVNRLNEFKHLQNQVPKNKEIII